MNKFLRKSISEVMSFLDIPSRSSCCWMNGKKIRYENVPWSKEKFESGYYENLVPAYTTEDVFRDLRRKSVIESDPTDEELVLAAEFYYRGKLAEYFQSARGVL